MVNSDKEGDKLVLRSRLRELLAIKMREEGRKILGKDLADEAGLNEGTVSRWMSPRPFTRIEYPAAKALADYFGLEWHEMVYEDVIRSDS